MFIVTAVETIGDTSGITEGGLGREATDKEMSGSVICDGLGYGLGSNSAVLSNMPQAVQLIFGGSGIVPAALVNVVTKFVSTAA